MKKFAIALGVLVVLAGFVVYNVWRGSVAPVTSPPSLVDVGRQQLHTQLQESAQREAEIEKQDWNSISLLRDVMKAHQHRIEQLSANPEAGEIIAHDKEAIARLEKRIEDLTAQEAARPAAQDQSTVDGQNVPEPASRQNGQPSPTPAHAQTSAQSPKTPQSTAPRQPATVPQPEKL